MRKDEGKERIRLTTIIRPSVVTKPTTAVHPDGSDEKVGSMKTTLSVKMSVNDDHRAYSRTRS